MKCITRLFIIMICTCGVGYNRYSQAQAQPSKEVRFVAAGIEDARRQLSSSQIVLSRVQTIPKEALAGFYAEEPQEARPRMDQDKVEAETAWWYYQEPQLCMVVKPDNNNSDQKQTDSDLVYSRLISNQTSATIFQEYEHKGEKLKTRGRFYYEGQLNDPEKVMRKGMWHFYEYLDPRFYTYTDVGKPLDEILLSNKPPAEYKGEEVIEGSKCMKLEVERYADWHEVFYIDTEHSFLIRRVQQYAGLPAKRILVGTTEASHLIESSGRWLPTLVERKDFVDGTGPNNTAIVQTIRISEFNANCQLPPEIFNVSWPIGTNVTDSVNQMSFKIVAANGKDLATLNKLKQEAAQAEKNSSKNEPEKH